MDEVPSLENGSVNQTDSVSIKALRPKTVAVISRLLNPPKYIPTEQGSLRDWQGLADLIGFSGELRPHIQAEADKTVQILRLWHERDREKATVQQLFRYLEELDRFDIVDDISNLVDEDIQCFDQYNKAVDPSGFDLNSDKVVLTVDDVANLEKGLPLQTYDAFVLFDDADIDNATELIDTLEKQHRLKLCVAVRDLVGGSIEFDATIKLITERCKRLIVIVSSNFSNSNANKFFLSFAQSVGIEQRQRKVIPCTFQPCSIPVELSCYHVLEYHRIEKFFNFYEKLRDSINSVPLERLQCRPAISDDFEKGRRSSDNTDRKTNSANTLGTKKHHTVKFKSASDLDQPEKDCIVPETNIVPSTSAESLGADSGSSDKVKSKKRWRIKILSNGKADGDKNIISKYKKLFWKKKAKEAT